ncbi:hypothetical protein ACWGLG_42215 [Streptomyces antimycoticus]
MSSITGSPGGGVDLADLGLGAGQADLESFDFAEPAFPLGLGDPVEEIVADLHQAPALCRVWPEQ